MSMRLKNWKTRLKELSNNISEQTNEWAGILSDTWVKRGLVVYPQCIIILGCPCVMLEGKKYELYNSIRQISLCPIMKPLHLFSITYFIRTYEALYIFDIKTFMWNYFLSQRYERVYVLFKDVETDTSHASLDAIHAMHRNPWARQPFRSEVQHTPLHRKYIALHQFYSLDWATIHITLWRSTLT